MQISTGTTSHRSINQATKNIIKDVIEDIDGTPDFVLVAFTSNYKQFMQNPKFVITGLSANFLIRKTLQDLGFKDIYSYETITSIPNNISSSAFAVAGALNNQILNH